MWFNWKSIWLLCLLSFSAGQAGAEQPITWMHPDYPPSFIVKGPAQGLGMLDGIERFVQQQLPEHLHQTRQGNMKRIVAMMAAGRHTCAASLFKTPEREKIIHFSKPYLVVLPPRIVIRKKDQEKFKPYLNQAGAVSLKHLLQASPFRFGFASGRAYGKGFDGVIQDQTHPGNSEELHTLTLSQDVFQMIAAGRLDYTVAFSYELSYFGRDTQRQGAFMTIPAVEAPGVLHNYMGCDKTRWGAQRIAEIDQILLRARTERGFYGSYYAWLSREDQQLYRTLVTQHYGQSAATVE
ncbi:TIGR02285 family protein [Magnetococcus sp. PR-3]|uniref:TIGR02285 family protein n=1 Tax=Magnetococcus sp. PR-3 TaxID=3120355 RepID=UPI002FCDE264